MPVISLNLPDDVIVDLRSTSLKTGLSQGAILRLILPAGLARVRDAVSDIGQLTLKPAGVPVPPTTPPTPKSIPKPTSPQDRTYSLSESKVYPRADGQPSRLPAEPPYANPFGLVPRKGGRSVWFRIDLVAKAYGLTQPELENVIDVEDDAEVFDGHTWIENLGCRQAAELCADPELRAKVQAWIDFWAANAS